ncbi:phage major tail protein, TP901-1 family [Listeria fleischmannii]|uniref:Phage major tail protein, TP901-1 family protein n=1 Tax=Listeria fleischmannii FSL S10-1203 TaxID=1265822 RepID=W7DWX8_9LIST|nr:phage major tail protein, TP901-1 family [Listeria fleischmannii]EUJ64741.1 phage major tail protein, TP901-1 family protein [Listeria fleischmannii FSL S10-1203]
MENQNLASQAIPGKDKKLIFRLMSERPYRKAGILALQVTHTYKSESKTESTQTKDGNVVGGGGKETSLELEALLSDTKTCHMLEYAQDTGSVLEVWEVNLSKPLGGNKYEARYGTGLLASWEMPAETDKNSSVKTTLNLNGSFGLLKTGATLDAEQQAAVKALGYDTIANPQPEEIVPVYEVVTEEEKVLLDAKNNAVAEVIALDALTDEQRTEFIDSINKAKDQAEVDSIVNEAKAAATP